MKVRVKARAIPGGDARRVTVTTQATRPGSIAVALCVQDEAIGWPGIIRDDGVPYVIRERGRRKVRVEDPTRFRDGFLDGVGRGDSHLRRFQRAHPDRVAVAMAGCGNLLCNRGVEARVAGRRLGLRGFMRAGIAVDAAGRGRLVAGRALARALDRGDADAFVLTGPLLVRNGCAVAPDAREFADLRHVLLPPWVDAGRGRRVDFGLDVLGRDPARARAAVAGKAVTLDLGALDPDALRAAMRAKGYVEARRVSKPGTYRIDGGRVRMAFLPGIYPHHALAIGRRGEVVSVVVSGRSSQEGVTVPEFAAALARAGARGAILLDNGNDARLARRPRAGVAAPPWPLRACLVYHSPRAAARRHSTSMRA